MPETFVLGPNVAHELIDGELVAINLDSGSYFSIRGSGAAIWNALLAGKSPGGIVEALQARFGEAGELAKDVAAYVERLQAEGLVVLGAVAPGGADEWMAGLSGYTAPEVEKFDDLADMFMLDPIHDVSAAGWPHVEAG
jgi:hypothetical protein